MSEKKEKKGMTEEAAARSEQTRGMEAAEAAELQSRVEKMTMEKLREYRNGLDADSMGFIGEEC